MCAVGKPVSPFARHRLVGSARPLRWWRPSAVRGRAGDRLPGGGAGLVPQRPGDRVKTDSRDARKLARLPAGGLLQAIHVPSPELEAARDLVRAREDARLDRMRDRHRLSKFCLRHGRMLPTSSWTVVRRKWLSEQRFEFAAQQITFDAYLHARSSLVVTPDQAAGAGGPRTAEQGPWRELVARLRCLRGIDTLARVFDDPVSAAGSGA